MKPYRLKIATITQDVLLQHALLCAENKALKAADKTKRTAEKSIFMYQANIIRELLNQIPSEKIPIKKCIEIAQGIKIIKMSPKLKKLFKEYNNLF